ncbi:700f5866-5227-4ac9-ab00-bc087f3a006b-CDS [Sclerotinia trifoliorum]|uniref:700f5866-5227-4ac9-ab00-bc087f3a006b-CDS n=1 Tax=Sclerotinia trifoliorum TaxID=28548 RepID=A0A8H2ZUL0_9HELO|nr:700f5866-5227-4ac9-ab00-bc087f3a006b-CDS [Sclerotinia trifoliorum]
MLLIHDEKNRYPTSFNLLATSNTNIINSSTKTVIAVNKKKKSRIMSLNKMDAECYIFKETFSDVCGHVTTVIVHQFFCARNHHDQFPFSQTSSPYPASSEIEKGFKLNFGNHHDIQSCRWADADIADSKCMYCQAVESSQFTNTDSSSSVLSQLLPSNTWISDPGIGEYKFIPPAEIQSRRAYWKNFIADQAILSQRQYKMQVNYHDAVKALANYVEELGQIINTETWEHLSWKITRAKKLLDFYEVDQDHYLLMVRSREASMECLFDPTNVTSLTHDLLYHVKSEEIPREEICSLCKEAFDSPDNRVDVVRAFCGLHLFHHGCIVKRFKKCEGLTDELSCPMCRKTCEYYSIPYFGPDWYSNSTDPDSSSDSSSDDAASNDSVNDNTAESIISLTIRILNDDTISDDSASDDAASDDAASDDSTSGDVLDGVH